MKITTQRLPGNRVLMTRRPDNSCEIPLPSGVTQATFEVDLKRYYKGDGYVQDVFHYLEAPYREFIMTGIHPEMWEDVFGQFADDDWFNKAVQPEAGMEF